MIRYLSRVMFTGFIVLIGTISAQGQEVSRVETFIHAARQAALQAETYDASYVKINPVNGDIPPDRGVCTDVVIRGLREVGIDLQALVNEDIKRRRDQYNLRQWDQTQPDRNIDHRRVANLMVYFEGEDDPFQTINAPDSSWQPCDLVVWNLNNSGGLCYHIGVISNTKGASGDYEVIHHLRGHDRVADALHEWTILGHYRPQLD